jgi:hypothetical protein
VFSSVGFGLVVNEAVELDPFDNTLPVRGRLPTFACWLGVGSGSIVLRILLVSAESDIFPGVVDGIGEGATGRPRNPNI